MREEQRIQHLINHVEEIKPCPFCGGIENETVFIGLCPPSHFRIVCIPCAIEMKQDRKDKVIFHWNQRASVKQMEGEWMPVTLGMPEVGEYKLLWLNGTWLKGKRLYFGAWRIIFADGEKDYNDDEIKVQFYMNEPQPPVTDKTIQP